MLGSAPPIPRRFSRRLAGGRSHDACLRTLTGGSPGARYPDGVESAEYLGPVTPGSAPVGSGLSRDDQALLTGLRAGDAASYEVLVRTHGGRLLAVSRRFLRNEADARDCVQDAFLLAFRRIHTFEGRSSVGTWLYRIVVNAALMKIRARLGQREESLDGLLPEFDALGNRLERSDPVGPPAEILVHRREVRDLVRQSIDRLPEGYRTVLILRDIEEYDTEETARLLDTTPGNVKTRLHRARAALKTLIEPLVSKGEP